MVPLLTELMDPQHMKAVKNVSHLPFLLSTLSFLSPLFTYPSLPLFLPLSLSLPLSLLSFLPSSLSLSPQYLDDITSVGKEETHLSTPYREG